MQREFRGTFGDFLAVKRKEADITIKDMAKKLKISLAYYSYFESGDRKAPERDVQDMIADILELSSAERLLLYDLAGKTRGIVAPSNDQKNFNPYANCSVQIARGHKGDMEKWLNFIKQFDVPPNTNG